MTDALKGLSSEQRDDFAQQDFDLFHPADQLTLDIFHGDLAPALAGGPVGHHRAGRIAQVKLAGQRVGRISVAISAV